jgi:AcrR family transcriptional regulator
MVARHATQYRKNEMREPLRQRKKLRTARLIEEVAAKLFEEQGFEATTLEQIAEAADIHKQTVLRYFRTKEDIAFSARNRAYRHFADGLATRSGTVLEHWRAYVDDISVGVAKTGVLRRWYDFLATDHRLYAYQLRLNQRFQATLATAFSEEDGVDPDTDLFAHALAAMIVSGTAEVAQMTMRLGQEKIVARNSNKVIDLAATLRRDTLGPVETRTPKAAGPKPGKTPRPADPPKPKAKPKAAKPAAEARATPSRRAKSSTARGE